MKASPYSPHYEQLRVWLKEQRGKRGLSLRDAAEVVGRHHSVLGKMEQDRRMIELTEFVEYCLLIGADPHEGLEVVIQSMQSPPTSEDA